MKQIGIGVIGLGEMGLSHANIYAQLPDVRLIGIYDINSALASTIAQRLGTQAFPSLEALLAAPEIEAVSICTPDNLHYESTVQALNAGKHILLEKPLTVDLTEGRELVRRAEQSPQVFMVGHVLRFDPRYYLTRQEVAEGNIGDLIHLYARRNNLLTNARRLRGRTSVAMFLGVHDIDVMLWLMESSVETVYASATSNLLKDLGVADTIMATLRFTSGAVGALEVSWVLPEQFVSGIDARLEVMGTQGAIYVDIHNQGLRVFKHGQLTYPDISYGTQLNGRFIGILKEELAEFILAIKEGRPSPVSAREAYRAVEVAVAIEESARTGEVVRLATEKRAQQP
ncbi:Gfo/Idh/MocA family oxidoreductase [Ktedonosporobacter rubrisoli]|uniref:Gfo/Idh/MocA family oxidoreductase n=1 Tax=Ktedonosporobacter rubrisoli TaxID=2509675 RepID=A0A4P6JKY3_KTERU|nr:Gfo/Idh/MocA family oxidoreductase [Ktedonosporobacter rubrisoli]QBD75825.1 Gfo/Idh/MocA family oxidoreductase [Ktedonosporobacter rubrisoli]